MKIRALLSFFGWCMYVFWVRKYYENCIGSVHSFDEWTWKSYNIDTCKNILFTLKVKSVRKFEWNKMPKWKCFQKFAERSNSCGRKWWPIQHSVLISWFIERNSIFRGPFCLLFLKLWSIKKLSWVRHCCPG